MTVGTLLCRCARKTGRSSPNFEAMRPNGPGRSETVSVTTADRSGTARVTEVTSRASSSQRRELSIAAEVDWAEGRRSSMASGLNGISVEEQVEIGLRAGLFAEPLPDQLGMLSVMINAEDPLSPLDGLASAPEHIRVGGSAADGRALDRQPWCVVPPALRRGTGA